MTIRALVACHCSMVVVDELRALGVDAYSCDLKPAEHETQYHIVGDAREVVRGDWNLLIASPVCRVMANSGAKHLYIDGQKPNGRYQPRWDEVTAAAEFFNVFARAEHIPHRLIENSIMHHYARKLVGRQAQVCQPWWFGDPYFKGMALWLYGLDPLVEPHGISLRNQIPRPGTRRHKEWSACHMATPGPDRDTERSRTHPGTARQWAIQCVDQIRNGRKQMQLFKDVA